MTTTQPGGVYRCPSPEEAGLTEDDWGGLCLDGTADIAQLDDGWFFAIYRPGMVSDWVELHGFASRSDALVAWCLATGRRHLCVVPSWEELGWVGFGGGMKSEDGSGWWYWDDSTHVEVADTAYNVEHEVEARWFVAVLKALEAGL